MFEKMKTYRSQSEIAINVRNEHTKKFTHVRFEPLTTGGSLFTTDDKELQDAIERHRYFGTAFSLVPTIDSRPLAPSSDLSESMAEGSDASRKNVMEFDAVSDAKDYVADTFGVSRTALRTKEQIVAAAARHGISIIWKMETPPRLHRTALLNFE